MGSGQVKYDAVIVGARVAGASTAIRLARAGLNVLLVDRGLLPSPTLSCPLYFGNTLSALDELGVLPRVEAIGAPRIYLYQLHSLGLVLTGRMLPYHGYDYAYSIRRELFDGVMFEYAAGLPGVDTRLSFNVTGLVQENGRVVGVRGSSGGKAAEEIGAELVVGADGANSLVARQAEAREYRLLPARNCVYFAYYSNVLLAGHEPTATIYYDHDLQAAFITSDSDSHLTVISLTLPAARFEQARLRADELHAEYARRIPGVAERLAAARRETPMYGVSPRRPHYRMPFGPGWALVGDAGYYKDPLPGQGIHDALRSSELLAAAFLEYRSTGAWERAMGRYRTARDAETSAMYEFTDHFSDLEHPFSHQENMLFKAIAGMPHWSDRFVSLFNGVSDPRTFRRPSTILAILSEWHARGMWRRLRGRPGPGPATRRV